MIKVSIIGAGNVAQHLITVLKTAENIELIQVFARNKNSLSTLDTITIVSSFDDLEEVDVYIIAVTDNAIATVANQIPFTNKLVVHTSGSVAITELNSKNRKGVFYPLQTFSKSKEVNFKEIPICLETETEADYAVLETIAKSISDKVYKIDSQQRKALHVAAVFVNNFVNHLYQIGNEICTENNIPFEILKPLILETAQKIMTLSPKEAQTGPGKRLDLMTLSSHLDFLEDKNRNKIYDILTNSIIENGNKL